MSKSAYIALCLEYGIDPAIALENDNIVAALQARDADKVATILSEEF